MQANSCSCDTIRDGPSVAICVFCHKYWRGGRELASVSRVIREASPDSYSWEGVDERVVENARERGAETDFLFSGYIAGTLTEIPVGIRHDARDRFLALQEWWDGLQPPAFAMSQVILADDVIAGTADVILTLPEVEIWDVKNVAKLQSTYPAQVAAYAQLYQAQYGATVSKIGVIHVTQQKHKPVIVRKVEYDFNAAMSQWLTLRHAWQGMRGKVAT